MKKIFKYEIKNGEVVIPFGAKIIRIDDVFDDQNSGSFLWAIVDPEEKEMISYQCKIKAYSAAPKPDFFSMSRVLLKVKEKQPISISGKPCSAGEDDGQIFVYYVPDGEVKKLYNIAVYKTGQEIDIPIEKLTYLGLNRLWIIMELGLYTFIVND